MLFTSLCCAIAGYAQRADVEFGKNRLQFKNFSWRYYSTENFEIYFYDGGNEMARIGANYLEKEFDRITDILGYSSYYKTKIFLYNSFSDLQQSNAGIDETGQAPGGQTTFIKTQVEIAFPGTMEEFKTELTFKVAEMLINDMMFGGSLSEMFQSSYLLSLPEWFISGAAAYVAEGWSVRMDDHIRELLKEANIKKLHNFEDEDARIIGQSIWNYIGEKYGKSYISNILNLTRIVRNDERSISGTIGVPFRTFLNEWRDYYQRQADFTHENYESPDKSHILVEGKDNSKLSSNVVSPGGGYLAYTKNIRGRFKVYVKRMDKNRKKVVLRGGHRVLNQEVDYDMPLLSWQDEQNLGVILNKFGKLWIYVINVNSGNKIRKELYRINQVSDFDIVKNGKVAVLSAERNGMSDLYLISLTRNSIKRITNDLYDDINPKFVPGTSSIVFSSNRENDTIYHTDKKISDIKDIYNVFIYNIDTSKNMVHRVTNILSKNIEPIAVNDHEIYYLSDQQGIFNIYKYNLNSKIYHQVTNYASSVMDFDIGTDKSFLTYIMKDGTEANLYLNPDPDLDRNIFTPQTKRQQYLNAKMVAKRFREKRDQLGTAISEEDIPDSLDIPSEKTLVDVHAPADTALIEVDTENFEFKEVKPDPKSEKEVEDEYADTDNYVFDTDVVKGDENESFLTRYRKLKKSNDLIGPLDYQTLFTADNVVTSFVIDPLIGLGINLETEMNDLLENHKFRGGVMTSTNLKGGNIYGEYEYLKYLLDLRLRYDRKAIFWPRSGQENQKYTLNKIETEVSVPFNVSSRFSLTPFYAFSKYYELDPSGYIFNQNAYTSTNHYLGIRGEFVYDNTVVTGLNRMQGTRGKIGYIHWEGTNDPSKTFGNFYLDLRNYQKLHRELVFATRFFYGRYTGPNKPLYLLGGMDNWLLFQENDDGENNPLSERAGEDNSDLLFLDYVTSLRGFDYNTFNGANALLFNAELRFPVISYFYRGHITSNFLRNLKLIAFYDIGSAWTGNSPFAKVNNINTEVISRGPFKATIQNFRNPWLQSYGFGVRTVLLGYYVKFDFAYPIEDNVRQNPRGFVTLGYDF